MDLTTSPVSAVYKPLDICDSTVSSSDQNSIVSDLEFGSFAKTSVDSSRLLNSPDDMGIPNTWPEEEPYPAPHSVLDYLPALPAPPGFEEMPVLVPHAETAAHYSSPVHSTLFSPEADVLQENDLKDAKATSGTCGLRNLGNTCFMNAGLQCLFNNRNMLQFFLEAYESDEGSKDSLCGKFAQLVGKVWSGNYSVIHPADFKEVLGRYHPQFRDYRQHDCQEFLALLLDSLHEHLNVASSKSSGCGSSIERRSPSITSVDDKTLEADFEENRSSPAEEEDDAEKKNVTMQSMEDVEPKEAEPEPVPPLYPCVSDNSSHSASPHSTDSFSSWDMSSNFRLQPVPEDVKPFRDVVSPLPKISETAVTLNSKVVKDNTVMPLRTLHQNNNNNEEHSPIENLAQRKSLLTYHKRTASQLTNMDAVADRKPEKNELANRIKTQDRKLPTIEDFVKDTKTLNTNVLVPEETNNQLKFDSEKFPKLEPTRPRETVDNLTTLGGKATKLKRVKDTNILLVQKDPKWVVDDLEKSGCSNSNLAVPKRMRMDSESSQDAMDLEQNPAGDDTEFAGRSGNCNRAVDNVAMPYDLDADKEWEQYIAKNQSVIVDTFQGQFQSTVVCSECGHVSVTYEPFMYLPVPLPHALERETVVTYIPLEGKGAMRFLITVHKHEKVYKIKEALLECLLGADPHDIILAEVSDNCISRILDDNILLRHLSSSDKQIYAFEVSPAPVVSPSANNSNKYDRLSFGDLDKPGTSRPQSPCSSSSACEGKGDVSSTTLCVSSTSWAGGGEVEGSGESDVVSSTTREFGSNFSASEPSQKKEKCATAAASSRPVSCAICLEEMPDRNLRTHPPCQCILCHSCIEISCRHYGSNSLMCPVCSIPVKPEEFVHINILEDFKMKVRLISVPVVYRFLAQNMEEVETQHLLGHPSLLRLPNSLPASTLYECVDKCVPFLATYSLHFVDGQGTNCSRCMYTQKCTGCEVARIGDLSLQPGDNLAVTFLENIELTNTVINHNSMDNWKEKESLTLYDCLQAFSESETLDEQNPWFCPVCQCNQQAKKSLSIWRCPDTVMVYLKRFMFHEFASTKVDDKVVFPLEELDLSPFVSSPLNDCLTYNLQACICHFGGLSSGHYTSYCKHAVSGDWHYYNDETIRLQRPQDEDHTHAYILFYQKPACLS